MHDNNRSKGPNWCICLMNSDSAKMSDTYIRFLELSLRYTLEKSHDLKVIVHSVVSDFLWPHGLQHARLPCPSPYPRACSNSCPLHRWCHSTILSSVVPFSSCLHRLLASGFFLMSWLFTSGGQSIGSSALALPMNIQDWFPLGWTGWISLQSKGLSRLFSNHSSKASVLQCSLWSNSHPYMTTGKTIALTWHCINSVEWITRLFVFSWLISSTFPTFFSYK